MTGNSDLGLGDVREELFTAVICLDALVKTVEF